MNGKIMNSPFNLHHLSYDKNYNFLYILLKFLKISIFEKDFYKKF